MALTPDDIFRANANLALRKKSPRAAYNYFTPRRVDKNQAEIVKAFRKLGATWTHLHMVGGGVWDGIVSIQWLNAWCEIKDGSKPPSARKLTPQEIDWGRAQSGIKAVAINTQDVYDVVNQMRWIISGAMGPCKQIGNKEAQYQL